MASAGWVLPLRGLFARGGEYNERRTRKRSAHGYSGSGSYAGSSYPPRVISEGCLDNHLVTLRFPYDLLGAGNDCLPSSTDPSLLYIRQRKAISVDKMNHASAWGT